VCLLPPLDFGNFAQQIPQLVAVANALTFCSFTGISGQSKVETQRPLRLTVGFEQLHDLFKSGRYLVASLLLS
jgi:hypothetical protein